jgi:type II secretory ATPase GspE/PulE/Tfp pilus assembly ATPase PilB-like protein
MTALLFQDLQRQLAALAGSTAVERVSRLVDAILAEAVRRGASDVHLEPTHQALAIKFRLDGMLHPVASLPRDIAPNLVARLKVLAELLTYRVDIPQEGRLHDAGQHYGVDMRVSTFPTIHGEKAAVRLFDFSSRVLDLEHLGLTPDLLQSLLGLLHERNGAILLTGPSGSGKTTTIYACLRRLAQEGGRHIVTIEDPVEQVIEGISQAQARPGTEFDFARGLRSLLRQDPEVIMVGEIRDPDTAGIAIEAALTGHLVFSTLHAESACGVVGRLLEMGIEPFLLTSGLKAILNQRLVRKACPACAGGTANVGLPLPPGHSPQERDRRIGGGCEACAGTGYQGRLLLAELVQIDAPLRRGILAKLDTAALEAIAREAGRPTLLDAARSAVARGWTTDEEIQRVLGPGSA